MAKTKKGFTIVELLIVIVVIGILATLVTSAYGNVQERARKSTVQSDLKGAKQRMEMAYTNEGAYPMDTSELKASPGTTFFLVTESSGKDYCLQATNGESTFSIGNTKALSEGGCVVREGLVAWWPFNGDATDASGNGHHGTVLGPTLTTGYGGQPDGAYYFSGGSQYIDAGTSPSLTPASISLSAWVEAESLGAWNGIISNMSGWGSGFSLQMGTAQKLGAMVNGSYLSTGWVPEAGRWYHVVATHDSSTSENVLYVDGVEEASVNRAVAYESGAKTYIGVFYTSPSLFFKGKIDDVRIYNRALSTEEVTATYRSGAK